MYTCPSCNIGKISVFSTLKSSPSGVITCPECKEKLVAVQPNFIQVFLVYMIFSFIIFHISPGFAIEIALLIAMIIAMAAIVIMKTTLRIVKK